MLSIIFLKVTSSIYSFLRKYLRIIQVWIIIVIISSKNGVPRKKWLVQLTAQTIIQVVFFKTTTILQYATQVLYTYFPSLPRLLKKSFTEEFSKINNFYCFIKDIHKWNWLFLNKWVEMKTAVTTSTVCATALIYAKVPALYLPLLLLISIIHAEQWKDKQYLNIITKNNFDLVD